MTTTQTLTSSITDEDGDFFSSMDDDDDDDGNGYGSSSFEYDRGGYGDGERRRPNYHPKRDHYHDNKHNQHHQQQMDKIRHEQEVQMQICSIMTDPYVSIPSLVQKVSRLVPGLLGLNEREKEHSRLPSDVIVTDSGGPADRCDEGGCQDFSYYRAKIIVFDYDDYSHCSPDSSRNADYRVAERSSFTSGGSSSPTSSVHNHDHLHRRSLPKLPMISDNTVDRLRHVFASEEIPFPNEELNFDTENGAMSSPGPNGGLCCHSAKTGVVGKIEVFKYAMLGRPQVPRGRNSLHRSDGSENHLQQILEPTPEQASRLERLAEQLGKVIVHRRKQQDTQRRVQKLTDSNRRLVESQNLARIGQWELDLTTTGSDSLYWSDAIYDIFRIPKTEFGASYEAFLNAIHPEDRKYVDDSYTNSLKSKQPYDIIHRLLFKGKNGDDDEVRWVREACRTEYDGDTPLYSVGIVQDLNSNQILHDGIAKMKSRIEGRGTTTATTTTTTMATTTVTTSTPMMQTKTSISEIPPAASEAGRKHDGADQQVCQEVAVCLKNILTSVYTLPENGNHQKLKAIQSCMDAMKLMKSMENSTRQESGTTDVVYVEKANDSNNDSPRWQQRPRDSRHQRQQTSRTSTSTRRSLSEDFRHSLLISDDDDDDHHHDCRDEESIQSNFLRQQQNNGNNKQVSSRSSFFLSQQVMPLSATRSPQKKNVIFSKCA